MLFLLPLLAAAYGTIYTVQEPGPVTWVDYPLGLNTLNVQWPVVTDGSFTVSYSVKGVATTLPATSANSAAIPCTLGNTATVSYTVTVSGEKSASSPAVFFLCAGLPKEVAGLTFTQVTNLLTLSWTNQDQSAVGTHVTKISVYRFTSAWSLVSTLPPSALSYLDTVTQGQVYTYKVTTSNWVGDSANPPQASWTAAPYMDAATSDLTHDNEAKTLTSYQVAVVAKDSDGVEVQYPAETLFFVVRDYCSIATSNYECVRVGSTNQYYHPDEIGAAGVYVQMTSSGSTYTAEYFPGYIGDYSAAVEMYRPGGLWGELWDNVHLYGVPDRTAVFSSLQQQWAEYQLITTYASSYVSIKLTGMVKSPVTERVTIFAQGDDGIRIYWRGSLAIDSWTTCCKESSFTVFLTQGQYYPIKVEYRQLEGSASFSVLWQSISIPKQKIPSQYLHYPARVKGSPWLLTTTLGQSTAALSYATGFQPMAAGSTLDISLFSVDSKGALINNPRDLFILTFTPSTEIIEILSEYAGNGKSTAAITLTRAGTYSVAITLFTVPIKNSPYQLVVTALAATAAQSVSQLAALVASVGFVVCGNRYTFGFTLYDQYGNLAASAPVDVLLTFKDLGEYVSPIGVNAPSDWEAVYGRDYTGSLNSDGKLSFSVFRAGLYSAAVRLSGVALSEGSVAISAKPSRVYAPRCVAVKPSLEVVAGVNYDLLVQARDEYYNVSKDSLGALTGVRCTATLGSTSSQAAVSDSQPGVFQFRLTLAAAGKYFVVVLIDSTPISNSGFEITVLSAKLSPEKSALGQVPAKIQAGTNVLVPLTVRDEFSNPYIGDLQNLNITIVSEGSGQLSSQAQNNNNGTFTVSFQPQRVDNYTLYCELDKVVIQGNFQKFKTSQGIVAAKKTVVSIATTKYTVASGTLPITSYDAFGNYIENPVNHPLMGAAQYKASFYGPATYELTATFDSFTNFLFDLTPVKAAGTYSVVVGLVQQGGLIGFYYAKSDFTDLVASFDFKNPAGIDPQKYSAIDSTIDFDWGTAGPSLLSASDSYSVKWVGYVHAQYTEQLSLIFTVKGLLRMKWNGSVLLDTVSSGVQSTVLRADVQVSRNTLYSITIEYVKLTGSAGLKIEWLSNRITRQVVPQSHLFSLLHSDASPLTLITAAASIDPGRFSFAQVATDPFSLFEIGLGNLKKFLLTTYDRFHNQLSTSATLTGAFVNSLVTAPTFTEVDPGLQSVAFTLTDLGDVSLNVFVTINQINRLVALYQGKVVDGMGTAEKSELSGVSDVVAGDLGTMTLTSKDYLGTIYVKGGDSIQYTVTSKTVTTVQLEDDSLVDNKDGTYTFSYRIKTIGTYEVGFTMNGDSTQVLDQSFKIIPGIASADHSTIKVPTSVKLNQEVPLTIQINDIYSNPVSSPQRIYAYLRHDSNEFFNKLQFTIKTVDESKGQYSGTVSYNIKDADSTNCVTYNTILRCTFIGTLLVEVWLMKPGLQQTVYSHVDLAGDVVLQQIQSVPLIDWTNSPIEGVSANDFSVLWSGHLLPTVDGTYGFTLTTAETAYLTMQRGGNVVEATPGPADGTIDLSEAHYSDFSLTYSSQSETPALSVSWQKPGAAKAELLPASVLFYRTEPQVGGSAAQVTGLNA